MLVHGFYFGAKLLPGRCNDQCAGGLKGFCFLPESLIGKQAGVKQLLLAGRQAAVQTFFYIMQLIR